MRVLYCARRHSSLSSISESHMPSTTFFKKFLTTFEPRLHGHSEHLHSKRAREYRNLFGCASTFLSFFFRPRNLQKATRLPHPSHTFSQASQSHPHIVRRPNCIKPKISKGSPYSCIQIASKTRFLKYALTVDIQRIISTKTAVLHGTAGRADPAARGRRRHRPGIPRSRRSAGSGPHRPTARWKSNVRE